MLIQLCVAEQISSALEWPRHDHDLHTLIALDFAEGIKLLNGLTVCNMPFDNFDFRNTFTDIMQLERGWFQSGRRLMKETRVYTKFAREIEGGRGSEGIRNGTDAGDR